MANTYFTDRVVQYPGRVTMTPTGNENEYDLARAEGNVTEPGTPFNADMFNRIANQIIQDIVTNSELTPTVTPLTISSEWASGYVNLLEIGNLTAVGITNLRRTAATNGYIDVATLPDGVSISDKSYFFGLPLYNANGTINFGAVRISNGKVQFNTGATVPNYGVYAVIIYV